MSTQERICFVIAPIGEAGSETRKRSDQILKHVVEPAALECGYKALRADRISEPGLITSQVIQHIVDDPLVLADLTDRNPNVFYELAIRHAIRKPLVQIVRKGDELPFDVAGTRTIQLDHHDLDSAEEAKREIAAQIRALEEDPSKLQTPISMTINLQALRQSDKPEQRSLGEVLSALNDLRANMMALGQRVEYLASTTIKQSDRAEHLSADYWNRLLHEIRHNPALSDPAGDVISSYIRALLVSQKRQGEAPEPAAPATTDPELKGKK